MRYRSVVGIFCAGMMIANTPAILPAVYAADAAATASQAAAAIRYAKVTAVGTNAVKVTFGEIEKPSAPAGGNMGTPPSSGDAPDGTGGTPPEMPEGMTPPSMGGSSDGAAPPEKPDGSGQGGRPDMSSLFKSGTETATISLKGVTITKNGQTASVSDISVGDILTLTYTGSTLSAVNIGAEMKPDGKSGMGKSVGQSSKAEIKGKYEAKGKAVTVSGKKLTSVSADTSVLAVSDGGRASVKSSKLYKKGDSSSEDQSNFYGLNAIVVTQSGSSADISGSYLWSDAEGANAVFAVGEDATVTVKDTTIVTKGNSSRGLDATLGGSITADNVKIKTSGAHCAPVATDRGGGTVTVDNSTLIASGDGSPCIYSTGDITVTGSKGKATGSQICVVEGKNSITLDRCTLIGAGKNGIMLYQSTSGDAEVGTAVLTANNSTLKTTSAGPMFYITNTDAVINLTGNKLIFTSGVLLDAAGNSTNNWGTPGKNGGNVTLNAVKQELSGDITCDEISTVSLDLKSSTFRGAVDADDTGSVSVALDSTSVWEVTADSYVTSISDSDTSYSNIRSNGHTIYYDKAASPSLGGRTITLSDGGRLVPQ